VRERRILMAMTALALLALAYRHPTADIRLITHDLTDRSPRRVQAAIDLGVFGVSFLYTWTVRRLR
jgi:type II secretory pathway component PulM